MPKWLASWGEGIEMPGDRSVASALIDTISILELYLWQGRRDKHQELTMADV